MKKFLAALLAAMLLPLGAVAETIVTSFYPIYLFTLNLTEGIEGIEVLHPDLSAEERERAIRIALEKDLFVSGGSDHSGLCGGMYDTYEDPTVSEHYIEPMSCGVPYEYFVELKNGKVNR